MELAAFKAIGMGLAIAFGVMGPGIGLGFATKAILESIARQPEAEDKMKTYFFIGIGLIEACALYAFVIAFMIMSLK